MTTFTALDGSTVTPITRADLMKHPAFADLGTDGDGNPCVWRNSYTCQGCTSEQIDWQDDWSCQCEDACPNCGKDHSPESSAWIAEGTDQPLNPGYQLWESLPEAGSPEGGKAVLAALIKPGPMWLCAWTENHGNNDLRDSFTLHETEAEAALAYLKALANDRLHCAAVAQISTATEPHWMGKA